jgi:16S rRNA A1518/A1519 N6-dimethyltransferase RsmA/KsgA/DIM1 with predicted DNA glycosylase/AP lyase activity
MSKVSFENYKHLALLPDVNNTTVSGRYTFQAEAERKILFDLLLKLDLNVSDSLLEIGCGPGNLLVPLSGFCRTSAGIDNEASLSRLRARFDSETEIHCYPGDFLEMALPETVLVQRELENSDV